MPCSKRKFTLQFPRCKFCADKIKSFFLTFKYPILDAPLKWLNNSELRYIPLIAQESNVSSSSTDVLFLVSSNKLPNLRCSQTDPVYLSIMKITFVLLIYCILIIVHKNQIIFIYNFEAYDVYHRKPQIILSLKFFFYQMTAYKILQYFLLIQTYSEA